MDNYDTPETVKQKLEPIAAMMGPFMHYIGYNHPGDWRDCDCYPNDDPLKVNDEPS